MESELDRFMARTAPPPDISRERVERIKGAVMARIDAQEGQARRVGASLPPAAFLARLGLPAALSLALGVLAGLHATPMASSAAGLARMVSNVYGTVVLY